MCKIAIDYAKEYDITINQIKCQFAHFSADPNATFKCNGVNFESLPNIIRLNVSSHVMIDPSYLFTRNINSVSI